MFKNGTRLRSQVCDTEVIIVRCGDELEDLRAGGAAMVPLGSELTSGAELAPGLDGGNALGKRYVSQGGAEVLVTNAGTGTLTLGSTPLTLKQA